MRLPPLVPALFALGIASAGAPAQAAQAAGADDEAVVFSNGDRLTGTIAAKGTKQVRFKTPYGLLVIPNEQIERLIYADGREEVITPPPIPPPPIVRLGITVGGDTFWQAWKPDASPEDPSLRFAVTLRGAPLVAYVDPILDPDDLPGSVVNSFVFDKERLVARAADGIKPAPPVREGGAVRLTFELPEDAAGPALLAFAYQRNEGTSAEPEWRTVAESSVEVDLGVDRETIVRLEQQRGQMDFHKGAMRRTETYHIAAIPGP